MRALDKKLLRDIRRLWAQSLAIALVLASGVMVMVMSYGAQRSLTETRDTYYERARFPDVWSAAARAPMSLVPEIASIEGVARVEARISEYAILDIDGLDTPGMGQIISIPASGEPQMNRLILREGHLPDPGHMNEVVVSEAFALAHDFHPGDGFQVTLNGQKRPLTITGVVLSPEFIYSIGPGSIMPDDKRFGIMWMPEDVLAAAFNLSGAFNSVTLGVTRGTEIVALRGDPPKGQGRFTPHPDGFGSSIELVEALAKTDLDVARTQTSTSSARMALVPVAALVLKRLIQTFHPKEIAISAYGIREGLLYEQMPDRLRARDPLIEAARFYEKKDARLPGFGKSLFAFLYPLFKNENAGRRRIIRAACLMHDVSWRAHPDYRHEVTFEAATRANLGGMTHEERVFLGVALLHRYKSSREDCHFKEVFSILSESELSKAEVLGKAMRFGAMFAVDKPHEKATLRWRPKKRELHLTIRPEAADLFGEVAEARFASLAQALNANTVVKIV